MYARILNNFFPHPFYKIMRSARHIVNRNNKNKRIKVLGYCVYVNSQCEPFFHEKAHIHIDVDGFKGYSWSSPIFNSDKYILRRCKNYMYRKFHRSFDSFSYTKSFSIQYSHSRYVALLADSVILRQRLTSSIFRLSEWGTLIKEKTLVKIVMVIVTIAACTELQKWLNYNA